MDRLNDSYIILSLLKVAVVVAVALYILRLGRKDEVNQFRGWHYLQTGFICIMLGTLVDVATHLTVVKRFILLGNPIARGLLEQGVAYIFGFIFLARGFALLMPIVKVLKLTQRKYNTIIADQTELIWCCSPDLTINFANEAFFRYFKLDVNTTTGFSHKIMMPAEDERKVEAMMDALTPQNPKGMVDHLVILPSGEQRWHRRKAKILFNGAGNPLEYHIISRDISERKLIEHALQQEKTELGAQVQLRAAELERTNISLRAEIAEREKAQRELLQAVSVANAANEAKSGFLANMGHELRTPMHGILTYSRFGIDKGSEVSRDKLLKYFTQINSSGHRLMRLLNDLLDLSKLQAGKMSYHFEQYDLKIIVLRVISELRFLASDKSITIKVTDIPEKVMVLCDQDRIRQVVSNLIDNAIKYSDLGTAITISFENRYVESNTISGPVITMSVVDQGIGIPEGERDSVFDMFIQSSKTFTGAGGTGLGLSICEEIVSAHKGRIYVEANDDGCGSVFKVDLPSDIKDVN